jgi:cysteine synthase A
MTARDVLAFGERPLARIPLPVGNTPVVSLRIRVDGRAATLRLKLESFNPCGSMKDRTAVSLYESVAKEVDPRIGIVESTSGNLGVALATIAAAQGVPFTAVVDPRTPEPAVRALQRLGADTIVVREDDSRGGYLLNRLRTVHLLLTERPGLTWTNQYENPANPRAHERGTAPELARQVRDDSVVLVAVSTGGTLAGMRWYAADSTRWTVIGVDVHGSWALGHTAGNRLLSGIGSSRRSSFATAGDGPIERVGAAEAVSACLWLLEECGIGVGASSGALVAAALRLLRRDGLDEVVCVCPDGAKNYLNTVYSQSWRRSAGIRPGPPPAGCESVDWETA